MMAGSAISDLSRPERRTLGDLLVRALAQSGGQVHRAELGRLVRDGPVDLLPMAAGLHSVSGSVLRGLAAVPDVPEVVTAALAAGRQGAAFAHLVTMGALSQIASEFDAAGIEWVVMKGPFLAAALYPHPGDRAYGDLDLLVTPDHFGPAMEILESLGYRHKIHNWALAESMLAGAVAMAGPFAEIDLHWHLHYSRDDRRQFAIDPEIMVRRGRRVVVSSATVPTLDAVDTALALGFHAARSGGHRLVWIKDIERSITVDRPDLDELVRRCRASRSGPSVGLILERAKQLLGAEIPDEIITALVPRGLRFAAAASRRPSERVQLGDRTTVTQLVTRSVRSSFGRTIAAGPRRGLVAARRRLFPPPVNESDRADEKARFVAAVAATGRSRRG